MSLTSSLNYDWYSHSYFHFPRDLVRSPSMIWGRLWRAHVKAEVARHYFLFYSLAAAARTTVTFLCRMRRMGYISLPYPQTTPIPSLGQRRAISTKQHTHCRPGWKANLAVIWFSRQRRNWEKPPWGAVKSSGAGRVGHAVGTAGEHLLRHHP